MSRVAASAGSGPNGKGDGWDASLDRRLRRALCIAALGPAPAHENETRALVRHAEALEEKLAGEAQIPVERLLAAVLSTNWLALQLAELKLAAVRMDETTVAFATILENKVSAAHRRLMSAVRLLDHVKKLPPANIRVHVTRKRPRDRTIDVTRPAIESNAT
jgi:thioredoxin-like negative regulator of GroEL